MQVQLGVIKKRGRNFSESVFRVTGARNALDRKNEFPF
jgi:hypothetical protein